jgi:hypothetical protein
MLYVIFDLKFDIQFEKCVKNAILGKDFNFGAIDFLFHAFTHDSLKIYYNTSLHKILQSWPTLN